MSALVKIESLRKNYYTKNVLNGIDIEFNKGHIYGLLGPNGSGKTTLMKVIAGLHKQNHGNVLVNDMEVSFKTKDSISFMPTDDYIPKNLKIKNIIKFHEAMYTDFDREKAEVLLKKMQLNMEEKVGDLSTGLYGRLKVVLAVSRKSPIYMFDEPLNGLDPISRDVVLDLIIDACDEERVIIISSHLVGELERSLDKVVFLKDGVIAINAEAEELRFDNSKSIEELYKEVYAQC